MEIILNFVWMVLAIAIVRLWLRYAPREDSSRRTQMVAVAMLILILLPVISVTDDLLSVQSLGEDVTSQRQDYIASHHHHFFAAVSTVPPSAFAELSVGFLCRVALFRLPVLKVENPALASIQNRPPPVA
jgi:thiol:disulfide interchange protein